MCSSDLMSPLNWEGRVRTKNGRYIWIQSISQPHRTKDGATEWDGVLVDITPRREAAELLRVVVEGLRAAARRGCVGLDRVRPLAFRRVRGEGRDDDPPPLVGGLRDSRRGERAHTDDQRGEPDTHMSLPADKASMTYGEAPRTGKRAGRDRAHGAGNSAVVLPVSQ